MTDTWKGRNDFWVGSIHNLSYHSFERKEIHKKIRSSMELAKSLER